MKPAIIGIGVLVVAVIAGLLLWSMMGDNDMNETDSNTSQQMDADSESMQNITELAASTESLSTLVTALQAANLTDTLADESAEFTVFAPTNEAFDALPEGTLASLLEEENRDQLSSILTYHVVPVAALSSELTDGQVLPTVQGGELTVAIEDAGVFIVDATGARAQVTMPDVRASNGVVHIIDSVLMSE